MMELTNLAFKEGMSLKSKKLFAQIIAPIAPHLAEEAWETLGMQDSIFDSAWPKFDKKYLQVETFELVIQVNGKVRAKVSASLKVTKEGAVELALAEPAIQAHLKGKKRLKEIYIPEKLLNIVLGE